MSQEPSTPEPQAMLRNIGIVAHINAGKTTLSERVLFDTGKQRVMGDVDDGTAAMDWMPEEQERGISISAAVTTVRWKGHRINLIDTPGHVDFTAEVRRCLRVLDGVVFVLDGVRGVESQTEILWREANVHAVPRIVFVNKLDRSVADFSAALASLRERLHVRALPVVLPLRAGGELVGLVDVIRGRVQRFSEDAPENAPVEAADARHALVEACADSDDAMLASFVSGAAVSDADLDRALRRACLSGSVVPVYCGTALQNRGVDLLLDAVCRCLPSPLDMPPVRSLDDASQVRRPLREDPMSALCFKVLRDEQVTLHLVRIYSGELAAGESVGTTAAAGELEIRSLYRMHVVDREEITRAGPGEVVALEGGESLSTGDTLFARGAPMRLEPVRFPDPVIVRSLEPESPAAAHALERAARELSFEDPTLQLRQDPLTGGFLVRGMGELHLDVFVDRLQKALRMRLRLGRPSVAMYETARRSAGATAECRRMLANGETTARVEVAIQPRPGTGMARVEDCVANQTRPETRAGHQALLEEMAAVLRTGLKEPYPARDLSLQLVFHELRPVHDEGVVLLLEALLVACRKAAAAAATALLEPRVDFEIECPPDAVSAVLADLHARQAEIRDVAAGHLYVGVRGIVRLAAVLGFTTRLRSITRGLGTMHVTSRDLVEVVADPEARQRAAEKDLRSLDRS